jgi:hypothetical protein
LKTPRMTIEDLIESTEVVFNCWDALHTDAFLFGVWFLILNYFLTLIVAEVLWFCVGYGMRNWHWFGLVLLGM